MLSVDQITIGTNKHDFRWEFRDKHYLVLWDKRDLPTVYKFCKLVRESHKAKREELLDIWGNTLERKLNDHKIPATNLIPESLEMSHTEDILTFRGITRFCELICLRSTATGHTVAIGTGISTAQAFDSKLDNELAHVKTSENGFFDPSGIRIWYAGTFGESLESNHFTESMLRDREGITGATVFSRNVFEANPIDHNKDNSGFTAAGVYEFVPIM
jgi:hypothetical protein